MSSPIVDNLSNHVKAEIDRLTKKQANALKVATRIGMTPEEAQQYESCQTEIVKLADELQKLCRVSPVSSD